MSAIGVAAAWLLSMTFLPALAAILPARTVVDRSGDTPMIERFGNMVIANRTKLLVGVGVVAIAVVSMTSRIQLDDRFVEYFDHSIPFRVDSDFARDNLSGIYQVEFSLGSGESGGVSNPDYLRTVDAFSEWLRAQPEVTHVNTMTDTMKRLNKSMHGDDESWYRLPDGRELAAQYLLLFEMSLPYGLDLNSLINVDKSASRLTVTLGDISSYEMRMVSERAEGWLADNAPAYMQAEGTSSAIMFAYIADRNIRSMLIGTGLAFVLISLTLIFALRSLRVGLISLIPNLTPAAMAFGVWGLFVGELGLAASVIAATSLGLIVDATVHILSKYVRARRERAMTPEDAVRYSFRTVGTALWVTTAVLVAGFAVLAFSSFRVNGELGILTAIAIAIALAIDFLLLPPLLLLFDRRKAEPAADTAPAHA
jgi:predicted RND superfamily exporter protein